MGKKKSKNKKYDQYDNVISMKMFLHDYLGAKDFDCSNLYHRGLKSLGIPLVLGISNEYALKNPECVRNGEVLKVIDAKGHIGTYVNPHFLKKYSDIKAQKETTEKIVSKMRLKELKQIDILYKKSQEIEEEIKKLETCREIIRLLTKDEHEAETKFDAMDKAAEEVQKRKKINEMLAETNY